MELAFDKGKLPWEGRLSLFEYVKLLLGLETQKGFEPEEDNELPDHAPLRGEWGFYDPGCDDYWDLYVNPIKNVKPQFINRLVDLFMACAIGEDLKAKIAFYKIVRDNPIVGYYEAFFKEMENRQIPVNTKILEFAYWMVRKAPDREVVKLGIILMGGTHHPMFLPTLKTIGRHGEFVFYVISSLSEITPDWESISMELVKPMWFFGRQLSVMFLIQYHQREETRRWCIRHGFQNLYDVGFIMSECIDELDVVKDLYEENWDEPLVNAVQVMIREILRSPILKTKDGGEIIYLYVKQFVSRKKGYVHYLVLKDLLVFFDQVAKDKKLLDTINLSEDKYSDIWIDVKNETQKPWFQNIRKMQGKEFKTYPYTIEDRCSKAYDELLCEKVNYNIVK